MQDGPRRKGRYLKRTSPLISKVSMQEFSFREICSFDLISFDNSEKSIVHTKYHTDIGMQKTVKDPEKFDIDLMPDGQRRPILRPLDFTRDWEREKSRRKTRVTRLFDEDDLEYEYEMAQSMARAEQQARRSGGGTKGDSGNTEGTSQRVEGVDSSSEEPNAESGAQDSSNASEPKDTPIEATDEGTGQSSPADADGAMEVIGKAIKNLEEGSEDDAAPQTASDPDAKSSTAEPTESVAASSSESEFIPANTDTKDVSVDQAHDPEEAAVEAYRKKIHDQLADDSAETFESAKTHGYQAGFKHGEEKGELQVRQDAEKLFNNLSSIISEFAILKKEVLSSIQDNFYDLCGAISESLIKKEFTMDPSVFANIIQRAVEDTVKADKFVIKVNPKVLEKIRAIEGHNLTEFLEADEHIEEFGFKVESDLSVVESNITKLISDLIDQADVQLFENKAAS
jgi:flagellar biosynthesis/type III secretory pathway protein FliH